MSRKKSRNEIAGPCAREWKERGHHGRTFVRFGFYCAPGDSGRGDQEGAHGHRAYLRGKGRQDREDRELGNAETGLSRGQTPRRDLHSPGDSHHARRADCRAGAAPARARQRDQVSDRAPGRGLEAAEETHAEAREARRAASAPDGGSSSGACTGARTSSRDKLALRSGTFSPRAIPVFFDSDEETPALAGHEVKGWNVWQKNRNKHRRREELRGVKVATAGTAADMADRGVKAGRAAEAQADRVVRADGRAGSGNISARRRFASSAWRRWISSTTSARTSCRSSCRSAGKFCLAG